MKKEIEMTYIVVKGTDLIKFEKEVQNHLKWGWRCQGGITVGKDIFLDYIFYQAMVKKK